MKLREEAIQFAYRNNKIRARIMLELNVSLPTIYRWLKANEENGNLTRLQVLLIFAEELGFDSIDLLVHKELAKLIKL